MFYQISSEMDSTPLYALKHTLNGQDLWRFESKFGQNCYINISLRSYIYLILTKIIKSFFKYNFKVIY